MYDSTHYEMGSTTKALTYRPSRMVEATIPTIGIVGLSFTGQHGDRRPGGRYQLLYDALGNQEVMTKTMTHQIVPISRKLLL